MTPFFCNTSSLFERKTKRKTLLSWCFQEGSVRHKPIRYCIAIYSSRMSPSPPQQVERTVHLDDQSRQFGTQATIERRAGRRKPLQRRRRTPMNRMARLFSRRTRSGSSTANAMNRRTCDRGRIPQPSRIRLWPSVGRHSFPQHRPHGAAEYQREAHGRMRG